MLIRYKELKNFVLKSLNGKIGKVKDVYFDDEFWSVRYLVVDTGTWLNTRKVLISPYSIEGIAPIFDLIEINLTKKQIEESPPLESDKPVSKQFQEQFYAHHNLPLNHAGTGVSMFGQANIGFVPYHLVKEGKLNEMENSADKEEWDPNLRSVEQVSGYSVKSIVDQVGYIDDFIFDTQTWEIRYLIVETHKWIPGKKVPISPKWLERISWPDSVIYTEITSDAIEEAEEYNEQLGIDRDYEIRLYEHYNRRKYWPDMTDESKLKNRK